MGVASPSFLMKRVGVERGRAMGEGECGGRKMRWVATWRGMGGSEGGVGAVVVERMGGVLVWMATRRSVRGSCWASEDMVEVVVEL